MPALLDEFYVGPRFSGQRKAIVGSGPTNGDLVRPAVLWPSDLRVTKLRVKDKLAAAILVASVQVVVAAHAEVLETGDLRDVVEDTGLTEYGAQVIATMNRVGMAIDVSHASDCTTLDAINVSRKPVLITHAMPGAQPTTPAL